MAKASGEYGIENEAWKYISKEMGEALWKLIRNIWKSEGIPEDWNREIISPIYKKGEKKEMKNHRGVTLMDTAYKIYAIMLKARLWSRWTKNYRKRNLDSEEEEERWMWYM